MDANDRPSDLSIGSRVAVVAGAKMGVVGRVIGWYADAEWQVLVDIGGGRTLCVGEADVVHLTRPLVLRDELARAAELSA